MDKLSVVIITFNEEKNIGRCIESVLEIADEILVVDSFSTDKTQQICLEYDVKFITHPFEGYIEQKNYAASLATYDYVLSLDADEALSVELRNNIKLIIQHFAFDGYTFNRLNNYCGKWIFHSGWYPDRKLRLWNRKKGKWGGENPHDRFELEVNGTETFLKGNLLHYSYSSISDHIAQANKFSTISAINSIKKGRKVRVIQALVNPFWRFVRNYFFKLGFLDGYYGFVVCIINSHENFLKYVKMIELQKKEKSRSYLPFRFKLK
jgi:glycosyltransferase involved in cell wall biosynthesis